MTNHRFENGLIDLDLPPMDDEFESEPSPFFDDDRDGTSESDQEESGLDAESSSGLIDPQELIDGNAAEDDASLLGESEPMEELLESDLDLFGDEQKSSDESDESAFVEFDIDVLETPSNTPVDDDQGAEGIDEKSTDDGPDDEVALSSLPDMDEDQELSDVPRDDTFGLELLREIAGNSLEHEEKREVLSDAPVEETELGDPSPVHTAEESLGFSGESEASEARSLGRDDLPALPISIIEPVQGVVSAAGLTLAWGNGVYTPAQGGVLKLPTRGLPRLAIQSVAVDPNNARNIVVGTDTDVYRSIDGGNTFEPTSAPTQTPISKYAMIDSLAPGNQRFQVAFTERQYEGRARLWALTPQGVLLFSEDLGSTWRPSGLEAPARHIATDSRGNLAVLVTDARQELLRAGSIDRWQQWSITQLPLATSGPVAFLAICDQVVLLGTGTPAAFFVMVDRNWTPLFKGLSRPIALIKEGATVAAYSWVLLRTDDVAVARWPLSPASKKPALVLSLDSRPEHLCAARTDGLTFLDVITKSAWYRVTVDPDDQ
jgi:hypothetical protein